MKKYLVSYITKGGVTVLNNYVYANSFQEAIEDIGEVLVILSCVPA